MHESIFLVTIHMRNSLDQFHHIGYAVFLIIAHIEGRCLHDLVLFWVSSLTRELCQYHLTRRLGGVRISTLERD